MADNMMTGQTVLPGATGGGLNDPQYGGVTQPLVVPSGSIGGTIGSIIDMVHGVNGTAVDQANGIADVADPFRQQRPQYQTELHNLLTDPNSFQMDAGTQFAINQGTNAITRAANAQGVSRGGSVVADIGNFVTGTANQAYNQRIQQLMALSGATTGSPAAAAAAIAQGNQNRQGDIAGGLSGLNSLFQTLFGTSSTSGVASSALQTLQRIFGGGNNGSDTVNDGSGGFQIPGGIGGIFTGNGPSTGDVIDSNVGPGDDVTGSISGGGNIPWITGGGGDGGIFAPIDDGGGDWGSVFGGP